MKEDIDRLLARTPLLKAREIAKELGLVRKEVNSFLHSHQDLYKKDAEFRWRLIEGAELLLTLPAGWVTGAEFETILHAEGPVLNGPFQQVKIVFSPKCKTMIDCTARVLALANQLVSKGKGVTMDFESAGQTKAYLNRAGFFEHLDESVTVLPSRPAESAADRYRGKSSTLVEFGAVNPHSANDHLIEQLTNKFVQQSTDDYQMVAFTVFSELIGNVMEHSQTPLRGFAGLQKYSGNKNHKDHIQTVVSDSGVGIASTLRPALRAHYPSLYERFGQRSLESDIGIVTAAMSEGGVSRFGGARGLGFKSSREQATKFNAKFSVRQERFYLTFVYKKGQLVEVQRQTKVTNLNGTHICFDFYLD